MRAVPPGFDLDEFIGRQLSQVGIGAHQMVLRFEGEYWISCEGLVMVELDGETSVIFRCEEPRWPGVAPLPLLVGRDVVSWCVEGSHEFSVTLGGDARLRFQSIDGPYESFGIFPSQQIL